MTFATLTRLLADMEVRRLQAEAVKPLLAGMLACAVMAVVCVIAAVTLVRPV